MRLHTILLTLPLFAPLPAQDQEMGPAKEQAKFHKLIGHWQGSGKVKASPDAEAGAWTAVSIAKSVLGGHFVREDTVIDLGSEAPAKLVLCTFYGYNRETKKWMSYGLSNMGGAVKSEVHWVDGKMVVGQSSTREGQLVVERWATKIGADSYSFNGYEAQGNGKPFLHVTGTFQRVKAVNASATGKGVKSFIPATKEMEFLTKWAGQYRLEGWMIMMPGQPKTDITGTETITPILGGLAIQFQLKGDPIPQMGSYEGWGAMLWNAESKTYQSMWLDNMGTAALENAYVVNGKFVVGAAMLAMGMPTVSNTVFSVGKDGRLASVKEHKMFGDSDPIHTFQATYTKKQ